MSIRESIIGKINKVKSDFDAVGKTISDKTEAANNLQKEVVQLVDAQKSMQGEYKALYEMGVELGILDKDGNVIPDASEVPTVPAEVVNNDNSSQN